MCRMIKSPTYVFPRVCTVSHYSLVSTGFLLPLFQLHNGLLDLNFPVPQEPLSLFLLLWCWLGWQKSGNPQPTSGTSRVNWRWASTRPVRRKSIQKTKPPHPLSGFSLHYRHLHVELPHGKSSQNEKPHTAALPWPVMTAISSSELKPNHLPLLHQMFQLILELLIPEQAPSRISRDAIGDNAVS